MTEGLPVPPSSTDTSPDSATATPRRETPKESRERLQQEANARARAELMARNPAGRFPQPVGGFAPSFRGPPPAPVAPARDPIAPVPSPAEAPAPVEATWQRVGRPVAALVEPAAAKAEKFLGRVNHKKILKADIKPPNRVIKPALGWARAMKAAFARQRRPGDASVPYFSAVASAMETFFSDGRGFVMRSFVAIGRMAGLGRVPESSGRSTVLKCIRWMEDNGWIGTKNVLYRDEDRTLKRDSNLYVQFEKETAEKIAALPFPARIDDRQNRTSNFLADLFRLVITPYGLNAVRPPPRRDRRRINPAPA